MIKNHYIFKNKSNKLYVIYFNSLINTVGYFCLVDFNLECIIIYFTWFSGDKNVKHNFFDRKRILFLLTFIAVLIFLFVLFKSYKVAITSNNPDALPIIKSGIGEIKVKAENNEIGKVEQNSFYDDLSDDNENINISILENDSTNLAGYAPELESKVNDLNINSKDSTIDNKKISIQDNLNHKENYLNKKDNDNYFKVQLIALKNREQAVDYINLTKKLYGELLKNLNIFISEADLEEKGIFYRVQVGNFLEKSSANDFCSEYLKRSNNNLTNCIVVK